MAKQNFKINVNVLDRVPRETAERIKSYVKALGCLDGASTGIVQPIGLLSSLSISFDSFGPPAEAPGHPGYGTWPWSYGLYFNDCANPANTFDYRQEHFRFPDNYAQFDNFFTDPGNAFLAITDFREEFGSDSVGTFTISASNGPTTAGAGTAMISPVLCKAVESELPGYIQSLPKDTEIVRAWINTKFTGLSCTNEHHVEYFRHNSSEGVNGLSHWDAQPAPDVHETETTAAIPKIGFGLVGKGQDGRWHSLGSAVDTDAGEVVDGYWRPLRCKGLAELILANRNSPYSMLALYPAMVPSAPAIEPDEFSHPAVGILMSIFNSMQSMTFEAVEGDPNAPWDGLVGYRMERTQHSITFNRWEIGGMYIQYKLPNGLLSKPLRMNVGGAMPACVDG
jgi:hypothetical protein